MSKQEIPFCTHDDLMSLPKADVEAIGIITYQADKINYNLISELAGFGDGGTIEDKNSFSYKKVSRKDINIKDKLKIKLCKGNIDVIVEGKKE